MQVAKVLSSDWLYQIAMKPTGTMVAGLGLGSLAGVRLQDSSGDKAEGRPPSAGDEIQQASKPENWLLIYCSLCLHCRATTQVSPTLSIIRTSMGTGDSLLSAPNRTLV